MTPLETLTNIGKLFGYMSVGMLLFLTVVGQTAYWFKSTKKAFATFPKHYQFLMHCAKWECFVLGGFGALYAVVALCRVLWQLIVSVW